MRPPHLPSRVERRRHEDHHLLPTTGRTKRVQATARRLSVVSATSCARRRLIRSVRPTNRANRFALIMEYLFIYAVIWGGPIIGFIALLLFLQPSLRPVRLTRTIGWLCASMSLPIGAAISTNTGFPLLILRPGSVFLGLLVSISYFVLQRRHSLPVATLTPAAVLLAGSIWDAFSLIMLFNPGFAGASC